MLQVTPLIKINKYFSYVIYKPICGGMSQGTQKKILPRILKFQCRVYMYINLIKPEAYVNF